jgi:hypothetical protein
MHTPLLLVLSACALAPGRPPAVGVRHSARSPARMSDAPDEGRAPALFERQVPYAQQAVVQLKEVQEGAFYDWAQLSRPALVVRLAATYALFASFGGWIASVTYVWPDDLMQIVLAANMGGVAMLLLFTLRIYSGWAYVSDRLGSAVLDYEESSWADGYSAKKPDEVRARDQYLDEFTVKPVLAKLKPVVAAISLAAVLSVATFSLVKGEADVQYSPEYLSTLSQDDKAAQAEAERAARSGKPAYCFDRYYKAMAGGGMCN